MTQLLVAYASIAGAAALLAYDTRTATPATEALASAAFGLVWPLVLAVLLLDLCSRLGRR